MKLNKAEKAVLIAAAVFIALLAGYHFGTDSSGGSFTVSTENKYAAMDTVIYATPSASPSPEAEIADAKPSPEPSGPVNINTASKDELRSLPGIGETLAERIIAYREESGAFTSTDEIMNVSGIGETKFAAIMDMITIADK